MFWQHPKGMSTTCYPGFDPFLQVLAEITHGHHGQVLPPTENAGEPGENQPEAKIIWGSWVSTITLW